MISLTELRAKLKENIIRGYLHYKKKLVDVLVKSWLLPETMKITTINSLPEREDTKKEINAKYNFLKYIRNSPTAWDPRYGNGWNYCIFFYVQDC